LAFLTRHLRHIAAQLILIGSLMAVCAMNAKAHEISAARMDVRFENGAMLGEIEMNLEAYLAGIGTEHDDTNSSPQSTLYDAMRAMSPERLSGEFNVRADSFVNALSVNADGQTLPVEITSFAVPDKGDVKEARYSTVSIAAALPEGTQTVQIGWDAALGQLIVRTASLGEDGYAALLDNGALSDPIAISGPTNVGFWAVLMDYISIGFEHIIPLGLDHILFVVGLFLLSTQLKPLLWQVTAFTLAHSVTLALGMLGVLNLPGSIVEPIIAASIVYIAIENILSPTMTRWRPYVVFGFGLLHGLGFAGVLSEFGMPPGQFAAALIGFNVGVELGQLTVIAICFALVGVAFGRKRWYRRAITIPGSLMVGAIGMWWLLERTLWAV
jgi:hypothetical protein